MNELSLFSGCGAGVIGTRLLGFRTVGYVEFNPKRQRTLLARIRDGYLDAAPIFGDIRAFLRDGYAHQYQGMADLVSGGFPCQPFSSASRGRRVAHDLWHEMRDVVMAVQPSYVFAENVVRQAIENATDDLRELGYVVRCAEVSAAAVGAPHERDRCWLLAHANNKEQPVLPVNAEVARIAEAARADWRQGPCPELLGMDDGDSDWMDRCAAVGNAQSPLAVVKAWTELTR